MLKHKKPERVCIHVPAFSTKNPEQETSIPDSLFGS